MSAEQPRMDDVATCPLCGSVVVVKATVDTMVKRYPKDAADHYREHAEWIDDVTKRNLLIGRMAPSEWKPKFEPCGHTQDERKKYLAGQSSLFEVKE